MTEENKIITVTPDTKVLKAMLLMTATMQGGIQLIFSHGNVLKNVVLQHVRVVIPSVRTLMFSRHESTSAARIEEHGFESTKISDVLTAKGKGSDGSWLWCTTDDYVYDAVKSMTQYNVGVGALVVVKPGEFLESLPKEGRSSKSTKVGDIMTEENKLITVTPGTKVLNTKVLKAI